MGEERLYLEPEKGDLIINTLYAGGIFKVQSFRLIKDLGVEAMLSSILITLGGTSFSIFLSWHLVYLHSAAYFSGVGDSAPVPRQGQ